MLINKCISNRDVTSYYEEGIIISRLIEVVSVSNIFSVKTILIIKNQKRNL